MTLAELLSLEWYDNDEICRYSVEKAMEALKSFRQAESDWNEVDEDGEQWVELSLHQPGELNYYPQLVFCRCGSEPGSVTSSTYKAL